MAMHRGTWVGLLLGAGLALWLLLANTRALLGTDIGAFGSALLVTVAWISLYLLSATPRGEFEQGLAPAEWKAWIGTAFMLVGVLYFIANRDAFAGSTPSPPALPVAARPVARNLVLLGVAWAILLQVMATRWRGRVQEDERDRAIAIQAAAAGRTTLIALLIALALLLGFSPVHRLQWATPFVLANLLVLQLMVAWLVEYALTALMYWRDRR